MTPEQRERLEELARLTFSLVDRCAIVSALHEHDELTECRALLRQIANKLNEADNGRVAFSRAEVDAIATAGGEEQA